ncbi:hypothetical protein F0562_029486 [Nyssa sinensis]|uniref:Uncharacterized protein n=1 Tax=Nyssa sinensis TaxID=561372 RepID=A0A5J5B2Y9_9ASTE|nr:hypothetical protein F0562_029486 [Nyssa sinensis]
MHMDGRMTESEYMKYKDPKQLINARIQDLMNRMTLAEKIRQMAQLDRRTETDRSFLSFHTRCDLSHGNLSKSNPSVHSLYCKQPTQATTTVHAVAALHAAVTRNPHRNPIETLRFQRIISKNLSLFHSQSLSLVFLRVPWILAQRSSGGPFSPVRTVPGVLRQEEIKKQQQRHKSSSSSKSKSQSSSTGPKLQISA